MPGIMPSFASSRKQIRQSPKSRIKPFFLPQRKQRLTILDENLGFLFARATTEVLAMCINQAFAREKIKALEKALFRHTSKGYGGCQRLSGTVSD
jgi:hypothetical protein